MKLSKEYFENPFIAVRDVGEMLLIEASADRAPSDLHCARREERGCIRL